MSYSQFDRAVINPSFTSADGTIELEIGGPLIVPEPERYISPVTIRFLLVHTPEDDHDPTHATRARGTKDIDLPNVRDGRWDATITVADVFAGPGEIRGVGVAVLEHKDLYGFETITWCDHVKLGPAGT